MTVVDIVILVFTLGMAFWGLSQGLIVGALSLAGFVGGALIGSRVAPLLLDDGSRSLYAPLVALIGALLLGGVLATIAETVGNAVRVRLGERLGVLDGAGGAVLMAALGLVLAWVAGAAMLSTPGLGDVRRDVQRSEVLQVLNRTLPPSNDILNTLARFDPFPDIDAPAPDLRPPPPGIARADGVEAAADSVVRVLGSACGLAVQGSGWVAEDGIVVTNAHVIAGQDDTTVQLEGAGEELDAEPIHYDPRNDLAILSVPGLSGVPALPIDDSTDPGSPAAILGFPLNGGFQIEPGRVGETVGIRSQDSYGRGPVRRQITQLVGRVVSGNSGGPMVDRRGRVVTTIFAATTGGDARGGYGVPMSIVADALSEPDEPVDTGPCAA